MAGLKEEYAQIKEQMEQPDFWNDIELANKITKKSKPIELKIKSYEELETKLEDIKTMLELAEEEDDDAMAQELTSELSGF